MEGEQRCNCLFTVADSELGTILSRAIQKSYHVHQQQYLARVRDLVLAHDPHEPPVAVGSPLPLDINFYDRWKKGEVKVGQRGASCEVCRQGGKKAMSMMLA